VFYIGGDTQQSSIEMVKNKDAERQVSEPEKITRRFLLTTLVSELSDTNKSFQGNIESLTVEELECYSLDLLNISSKLGMVAKCLCIASSRGTGDPPKQHNENNTHRRHRRDTGPRHHRGKHPT
jgi:hypothetical protein